MFSFFALFLPMLLALICWSLIIEAVNLGLGFFYRKRDKAQLQKIQDKIDNGEEIPEEFHLVDMMTGLPLLRSRYDDDKEKAEEPRYGTYL